jgi:hypothetical protein
MSWKLRKDPKVQRAQRVVDRRLRYGAARLLQRGITRTLDGYTYEQLHALFDKR